MGLSPTIERRAAALEVRANGSRLAGYAAVFDSIADIGDYRETIAPGAFSASLARNADILALCDHDRRQVLGRTRSGSLRLSEDSRGLAFELMLPDTSAAHDVRALAERGDLGGMSFGFKVERDSWQGNLRTLQAIDLREISVVSAWPAYEGTSVALRARDASLARERRRRAIRLLEARAWA